jgi:hypothetical protein
MFIRTYFFTMTHDITSQNIDLSSLITLYICSDEETDQYHVVSACTTPQQWCTQEFFSVGGHQIQLRTEDRENGDLGAVAPYSGVLEAAVIWYKKFHFT